MQTFYELYEDDAQVGVDLLHWKMTMCGCPSYTESGTALYAILALQEVFLCSCKAVMCCSTGVGHCRQVGCPQSGIHEATQRLVAAGYKVGIIEQVETAAEAKAKRGPKVL